MRNLVKIVWLFVLLLPAISALAQPTITTPTVTAITNNGATLGGNVTAGAGITARGTRWHTSSPVGTNNELAEGGTTTGVFSHARTGMPSGTQIFYVAYATNAGGTATTAEQSFFTLSNEPAAHPASFTATTVADDQIDLNFSAASTITDADGYIILVRTDGTDPDATGVVDGAMPGALVLPGGTSLVTTVTSSATTSFSHMALTDETQYNYAIIPFNYNGTDAATYNYRTSATIQTDNAYTFSLEPNAHPAAFTATTVAANQIDLTFSAASTLTDADGYIILRRTDGSDPDATGVVDGVAPGSLSLPGGTALVTTISSTATTTFSHMGLTSGTHYNYAIIPYNYDGANDGTYNYRTAATIQTDDDFTLSTEPGAHAASFVATTGGETQIDLSFSAASTLTNADGYIILRRQDGSFPDGTNVNDGTAPGSLALPAGTTLVTTISNSATTTYNNTGLTAQTRYRYALIPFNYNGSDDQTYNYLTAATIPTDDAFTLALEPAAHPATFTASAGSATQIDLAFSAASTITNADGYIILRRQDNNDPTATGVTDGTAPGSLSLPGGTTLVTTITNSATTTFANTGLTTNQDYNYAIIPFNYNGTNNETYNYRTSATILTAQEAPSSGVTITAATTTSACVGNYTTLSDIRITENSNSDFSSGGTLIFEFDNPAFSFQPGQGNLGWTSCCDSGDDLTSASIVVNASRVTITYALDGTTNKKDTIFISGLRVTYDGTSPPQTGNIRRTGGTATQNGNGVGANNFGIVNNGSGPAAPTLTSFSSGSGTYCQGSNISGVTVTVSGTSVKWYSDAGLTTQVGSGNTVNIQSTLGINSAATGTFTRYATQTVGCESSALAVNVVISPIPTADAGADFSTCPGSPITLGGSPTLANPSVPGAYTYAWTSAPAGFTSSAPNPGLNAPANAGASDINVTYTVNITDVNGCSDNDNVVVTIKEISQAVSITQPAYFYFTTNDNVVDLQGQPTGGVFSGVGVTQLNGSYRFNPGQAGVGNWLITYTATLANGCSKSVIETFNVSAPSYLFSGLEQQYCNNEGTVNLQLANTTATDLINYINTWNTVYVPNYGYSPIKATSLDVKVRNYYAAPAPYGYGANSAVTGPSGTYSAGGQVFNRYFFNPTVFQTDQSQYPNCPTCNYAYVGIYLEFVSPASTYPYNIPAGQDRAGSYNDGTNAGFLWRGQSVTINHIPNVFFSGLESGLVNPDDFCNISTNYNLSGSKPGLGQFQINTGSGFVDGVGTGLIDNDNGTAIFNPNDAFSGGVPKAVTVRYYVDPGTNGSSGQDCYVPSNKVVTIYPLDSHYFLDDSSPPPGPTPDDGADFCYEGNKVLLDTDKGAGVTWSGFGVVGNGDTDRTAFFVPQLAFDQSNPASTIPLDIVVTATFTSAQGCPIPINRTFTVYPKPVASYTVRDVNNVVVTDFTFCYTDDKVELTGSHPAPVSSYEIRFTDFDPYKIEVIDDSAKIFFDPSRYFDKAVSKGASNISDAHFEIIYHTEDGIGCPATFSRVFIVSPRINVLISGITNNEVYCANEPDPRLLTFTPADGELFINGLQKVLVNGNTFSFADNDGGTNVISYTYYSGTNLCPNNLTYTVNVVPAPIANFSVVPVCDGTTINYTAGTTGNNSDYTWIIGDSIQSAVSITHKFPGLAEGTTYTTYSIKLVVKNDGNPIVCADSLSRDQVIGANPKAGFTFSNICENDFTQFTRISSVPVTTTSQWDFGDGNTLAKNPNNNSVPGGTHSGNTTGTFGNPQHKFAYVPNATYTVTLTARTPVEYGECQDVVTRVVPILANMTPSPASPYSMSTLNGGDGFWVKQDDADSTTWSFGAVSKPVISIPGSAWITNLTGDYKANDKSSVNSPCFDLTAFSRPVVSLQYWGNTDPSKDGAVLQFSVNGGKTWFPLGTQTTGIDWFNDGSISASPGGQDLGWSGRAQSAIKTGKHSMDLIPVAKRDSVRLRIAFASDERVQDDGFAFFDLRIEERNRFMLLENFTTAQSTTNNTNFGNVSNPEAIKVQYHTGFANNDPIHTANPEDHNARAAYYGLTVNNVPLGFLDGVRGAPFLTTWYNSALSLRSLKASPVELEITTQPADDNELAVSVKITPVANITTGQPTLRVAVLEKVLGTDRFVMRKLIPTASGTRLTLPITSIQNGGSEININFDPWIAKGITDVSQIAIVAFVQDDVSKEVLQTTILTNPTNLPSVITGIESLYGNHVQVYPSPSDLEVNIVMPEPVRQSTPIRMFDGFGKAVAQDIYKPGEQSKTIRTKELAGGVYLIQVETTKGIVRKKIMVTHQ